MGERRPNVIFFFVDQQRWDTTGVHGNPMGLTPNFDRLAAQGTHLYNTITCQPVCGPARASLQTGLYATNTGCYRNAIPLARDAKTLAHHFNDAGYHTGYIGKWHLASQEPVPSDEQGGYQYWLGANVLEFTSESYRTVMYDRDGNDVRLPGYRVDALTDAAIRYVDEHQSDPFFLFLSFIEPHHQNHIDDYPPPDGYREMYTGGWVPPDLQALVGSAPQHLGGYYGMVKRLDEALGRLMDALKSLDLLEDTVVFYTSDHGSHFKTRNSEYKRSCHESCVRIPTMIRGPGFMSGGQIRDLVSLVDLPPTVLDAAGLPVPEEMEGNSVKPLVTGQREGWQDDVYIQISEAQVGRAIRTHKWKYCVDAPDADGRGDAYSSVYEEQYLYDLDADPYELTNLIGKTSHREVADRLKKRLLDRMAAVGEEIPEIRAAPESRSGQRRVSGPEVQA